MADHPANSGVVVVIGGGFGGLTFALSLIRERPGIPIILIEPRSRFVFIPLLYELLSGEMSPWEISPSYKSLVAGKGIVLIEECVEKIDTNKKTVSTSSGQIINYAQLVISTGSKPNYFGIPGLPEFALMFNQIEDIQKLKDLIFRLNKSSQERHSLVIVGAGSTGVELACKVSDLLDSHIQVHLIEAGERVLAQGKSFNQEQTERALEKRGINLHLQNVVTAVTADSVQISNVKMKDSDFQPFSISYSGLIWTAGVNAALPFGIPAECLFEGRVLIDSALKIKGLEDAFALGDIACDKDNPCMATAQLAMQHGQLAAENIIALREERSLKNFVFRDNGEMLSLGIGDATVTAWGITLSGSLAFQLRRLVYLSKLPTVSLGIRSAGAWLIPNSKKSF